MKKNLSIALFDSTNSVIEFFLCLLKKNKFCIKDLFLLDEKENIGKKIYFDRKEHLINDVNLFDWSKVKIVLFFSKKKYNIFHLKKAKKKGCTIINASGFFLFEKNVSLIVPRVNSEILYNNPKKKIISIADSDVIQLIKSIKPIIDLVKINKLIVINLFPASFYGKKMLNKLAKQSMNLLNGISLASYEINEQIAFNIIPLSNYSNYFKLKEKRFIKQVHKILKNRSLNVSVNFFQIPVFYGITQIVYIETSHFIQSKDIYEKFSKVSDIHLIKEGNFLNQFQNSAKYYLTLGCIKNDNLYKNLITFCSVSDHIKFGIAKMLIEILKIII